MQARQRRAATRRGGAACRCAGAAAPRPSATHTSWPAAPPLAARRAAEKRRAPGPQAAPGGAQRPRGEARHSPPSTPVGMRSSCSARRASSPARRTRCRRPNPPARAHAHAFELRAQPAHQLRPASLSRPGWALPRPAPAPQHARARSAAPRARAAGAQAAGGAHKPFGRAGGRPPRRRERGCWRSRAAPRPFSALTCADGAVEQRLNMQHAQSAAVRRRFELGRTSAALSLSQKSNAK